MPAVERNDLIGDGRVSLNQLLQQTSDKIDGRLIILFFIAAIGERNGCILVLERLLEVVYNDRSKIPTS